MPGLPVRLVRRDGREISLDCTDYMLQVNRMVRSTPIPFTGERYGGDLNMVTTSIRLNVVLRDDNCAGVSSEVTQATASIDFTQTMAPDAGDSFLPTSFMKADSGTMTRALLDDTVIEIPARASDGSITELKMTLKDSASNPTGYDTPSATMVVSMNKIHDGILKLPAEPTGVEVATFVRQYIVRNSVFAGLVTATLDTSGIVTLTNVNKGGWREDVTCTTAGDNLEPIVRGFSGGFAQSCYSAGDKMQNLMGSVANNTILGGVGSVFGVGGKKGMLSVDFDLLGKQDSDSYESDYIVGLLLPYNSLVGVSSGLQQKDAPQSYVARNFFYATGFAEDNKGAEANANKDTSMSFDMQDKYSGIRGTVTAVEFKYNAGSTVYEGSITFGPMDAIVGV